MVSRDIEGEGKARCPIIYIQESPAGHMRGPVHGYAARKGTSIQVVNPFLLRIR
jgi:hypothetical protein